MNDSPSDDDTVVLEQNFFDHTSPSPNSKTSSGAQNATEVNKEQA